MSFSALLIFVLLIVIMRIQRRKREIQKFWKLEEIEKEKFKSIAEKLEEDATLALEETERLRQETELLRHDIAI